jgi:hypothetical protein
VLGAWSSSSGQELLAVAAGVVAAAAAAARMSRDKVLSTCAVRHCALPQ